MSIKYQTKLTMESLKTIVRNCPTETTLSVNDHIGLCEDIERYLTGRHGPKMDEPLRRECIETNQVWEIRAGDLRRAGPSFASIAGDTYSSSQADMELLERFLMIAEHCKGGVWLQVNGHLCDHTVNGVTSELGMPRYISDTLPEDVDQVTLEEARALLRECTESGQIWHLQAYPITHVAFLMADGPSLERVVDEMFEYLGLGGETS